MDYMYHDGFWCIVQIHNRPQPGDVLTLNNRRVLHSRTVFTLNGGVRHIQVRKQVLWLGSLNLS